MHITRAGDYGIRGMLYLASLPAGKDAYIKEIAREQEIPHSFLAKIFQNLTRAGLIHSHRGAKGGFALAKPAKEISLLDIIESIEGAVSLNLCLKEESACPRQATCTIYPILKEAQDSAIAILSRYSLEDIRNSPQK